MYCRRILILLLFTGSIELRIHSPIYNAYEDLCISAVAGSYITPCRVALFAPL